MRIRPSTLLKAMFVICLLSRTLSAQTPPPSLPKNESTVIVKGDLVWDAGKPTGARPGRVLPN
jgi:hypothetical protein